MTIKDIMRGADSAEIVCLFKGTVVRRLTRDGDSVIIDALTEKVRVPLDLPIFYEPWCFDRGNMLFNGSMKLCTEGDLIRYPNGEERSVLP